MVITMPVIYQSDTATFKTNCTCEQLSKPAILFTTNVGISSEVHLTSFHRIVHACVHSAG